MTSKAITEPGARSWHAVRPAMPEANEVFHVSGADDFLVHVAVADVPSLHDFILDALTACREVAHETHLIFDQKRKPAVESV